jgi:uncharacterized Zn finger protein
MRRRRSTWDGFSYYRPEPPKAVKGGIRARSQRGAFASQWWGRRWIATLEGFSIGARLGRGRSYARGGQVADLTIEPGRVTAAVQGTRSKPYAVEIRLKVLTQAQWGEVLAALAEQPIQAARLLAGEMPPSFEELFQGLHFSLFPARQDDLKTQCSCPDWSNPCKHIAAVYYLLGEAFDGDPFLLLKLRGMEREALFARLGTAGSGPREREVERAAETAEPLPADPAAFWRGAPAADGPWIPGAPAPVNAAAVKRLGPFPFWRGREDFMNAMERLYNEAAAALARDRGEPPHS